MPRVVSDLSITYQVAVKTIHQISYKASREGHPHGRNPQFNYRAPQIDCRIIRNPYFEGITMEQAEAKVRKDPNFEPEVARGLRLLSTNDVLVVGCLYGKHRSVVVATEIARRAAQQYNVVVHYQDGRVWRSHYDEKKA